MTRNGAKNLTFFCEVDGLFSVRGQDRKDAERLVLANHYAHSLPSGKTHVYAGRAAVVMFSIPANRFAARVLLGRDGDVWELTRLWAPDGPAETAVFPGHRALRQRALSAVRLRLAAI